jgi:hypothetical protein
VGPFLQHDFAKIEKIWHSQVLELNLRSEAHEEMIKNDHWLQRQDDYTQICVREQTGLRLKVLLFFGL